jgi:hypothetical protein
VATRRYNRGSKKAVSRKFGGKPNESKLQAELNGSKRTKKQRSAEDKPRLFDFVIVALTVDYALLKEQGASYYFPEVKHAIQQSTGAVYQSFGHVPMAKNTAVYLVVKKNVKWIKPILQVVSKAATRWVQVPESIRSK